MPYAKRIIFDDVRSLAFGSIVAGYTAVGTALGFPSRIIFIQNLTDALLMFSFDGTSDNFPLPAGGFILLDVTSNKAKNDAFFMSEGDILHVKRVGTPTTGSVYFSNMYGKGD